MLNPLVLLVHPTLCNVLYKFKDQLLLQDITSHQEMLLLAQLGSLLVLMLLAELPA